MKKIVLGSLPLGLLSGIFIGFEFGLVAGIIGGIVIGIYFGYSMTIQMENWLNSRKAKYPNPIQTTELEIEGEIGDVLIKCNQALVRVGSKVKKRDREKFKLTGVTGMSRESWGEVISIELTQLEEKRTKVSVSSRPKVKGAKLDFGKGKDNVDSVCALLEAEYGALSSLSHSGSGADKERWSREKLDTRCADQKQEDIIITINLGTRKAGLNASDMRNISLIMAYVHKAAGMSLREAFDYSVLTIILTKDGTKEERVGAGQTFSSAISWELELTKEKGFKEVMMQKMRFAHLVSDYMVEMYGNTVK